MSSQRQHHSSKLPPTTKKEPLASIHQMDTEMERMERRRVLLANGSTQLQFGDPIKVEFRSPVNGQPYVHSVCGTVFSADEDCVFLDLNQAIPAGFSRLIIWRAPRVSG